jgi:hypothetical protein
MKRAAFWLTVGGAALLANFGIEFAASKFGDRVPGLAHFAQFIHGGGSK